MSVKYFGERVATRKVLPNKVKELLSNISLDTFAERRIEPQYLAIPCPMVVVISSKLEVRFMATGFKC